MGLTNQNIKEYLEKNDFQKRIDQLAKKYKNKKIMIYGASMTFGLIREKYDLTKLNIIGVADIKFDDGQEYAGYKTYNSYTFLQEKPDVVLIAMLETETAEDFFEDVLMPKFGKFKYDTLIKYSFFDVVKEIFSVK